MDDRYTMYNNANKAFVIMLETKMRIEYSRHENYPIFKYYEELITLFLIAVNTDTNGIPNNIVIAKSNPGLMDRIYGFLADYEWIPIVTVSRGIGLYNTTNKAIIYCKHVKWSE